MHSKLYDFDCDYERKVWYKKSKNWIAPSFLVFFFGVIVACVWVQEYDKVISFYNDLSVAREECERGHITSDYNSKNCMKAKGVVLSNPYIVALGRTGYILGDGIINVIKSIGKSYVFAITLAFVVGLLVFYVYVPNGKAKENIIDMATFGQSAWAYNFAKQLQGNPTPNTNLFSFTKEHEKQK